MKRRVLLAAVLPLTLAACTEQEPTSVGAPARNAVASYTVTGQVRGPGGAPICNYISGSFSVRMMNFAATPDAPVASQTITCPSDSYSITVPEGQYVIRLGANNPINHPAVFYDPNPIVVAGETLRHVYWYGQPLRGRAVMDGERINGAVLDVVSHASDFNRGFVGSVMSRNDGTWHMGDFRAFLQENVEYTFTCATLLGARAITQPFRAQFGDSLTHVNCRYGASDGAAITHSATRVLFTPTPGNFGAHVQMRDGGYGYGLQYLNTVGAEPSRSADASPLFGGGFVFAVNDQLVTTFTLSDYGLCVGCSRLDPSTQPRVTQTEGARKRVMSVLGEPVGTDHGISIRQETADGALGDYILVRLGIKNLTTADAVVYGGLFMDWDVWGNAGAAANTASSLMDGRLVYTTGEGGKFYGTLFLGSWRSNNTYVKRNSGADPLSNDQLLQVLKGTLSRPTGGTLQADWHTLQGVGRIPVAAGRTRYLWAAIVAGSTLGELEANANAAIAEFNSF